MNELPNALTVHISGPSIGREHRSTQALHSSKQGFNLPRIIDDRPLES